MTDTTHDDDFYPASAGDDPIWLGGVEYITKKRSDDLVQAAVAAKLREADQAIQSVASNCTTEDGHVAIVAAVEKVRSLITPDAQAVLNRVVAAKLREAAGALFKWGDIYGDNAALCVLALIPKEKSDA